MIARSRLGPFLALLVTPLLACGAPDDTAAQQADGGTSSAEVHRLMGSSDWETDFSKHVGMTAAYRRTVEGRTLSFEPAGDRFRDRETGSEWNLAGRAVSGPLEGARLDPLQHGNHFWFAWAAFQPETRIWPSEETTP